MQWRFFFFSQAKKFTHSACKTKLSIPHTQIIVTALKAVRFYHSSVGIVCLCCFWMPKCPLAGSSHLNEHTHNHTYCGWSIEAFHLFSWLFGYKYYLTHTRHGHTNHTCKCSSHTDRETQWGEKAVSVWHTLILRICDTYKPQWAQQFAV